MKLQKKRIKFGQKNVQAVLSERRKIDVTKRLTQKGFRLMKELKEQNLSKKEYLKQANLIKEKYEKNYYTINKNAKIIKMIRHEC